MTNQSRIIDITVQVGVLGAGQMGNGIAKVLITNAKLPVQLYDNKIENARKAEAFIRKILSSFIH
jgi:3-hydroxyacyl-CoA dehydrogenase